MAKLQLRRQASRRPLVRLVVEPLESRLLLTGGVTILTHGFQTSTGIPLWELTMAQAILDRADGPLTSRDTGSVFQHNAETGNWEPAATNIWTNSNSSSDHVVLLYDWSAESGLFQDGWLEAAADHLFASLLQTNDNLPGDFVDASFFELACNDVQACTYLDFHFIGHSRGAVLNSLVTSRLGYYFPEVTVDQVTALDPHPASFMNDLGYVPTNPNVNSRLFTYDNVQFADSYFRQDAFYELNGDFNGVIADGAFNLQIPEDILVGSGYSFEHLDVHAWYYGTITEPFDATYAGYNGSGRNHDGEVSFPDSWFGVPGVPARDHVGYLFSRIGAGDRDQLPSQYQFLGVASAPTTPVTVFNGDFAIGSTGSATFPGWSYHASGGSALISGPTRYLEMTPLQNWRAHNPLYIAPHAAAVEFDYWISTADSAGDDQLLVWLGESLIDQLSLGATTAGFVSGYQAPVDFAHDGLVAALKLELVDGGTGGLNSVVRIDNIRWVAAPPLLGDFDQNGALDCNDINALSTAIAAGSTDLTYDLNDDQVVTIADLNVWLAVAGQMNLASGAPYLRGDANLDGLVDGLDFIIWNQHKFTANSQWCAGDFNADGVIDGLDFIAWNENKFSAADVILAVDRAFEDISLLVPPAATLTSIDGSLGRPSSGLPQFQASETLSTTRTSRLRFQMPWSAAPSVLRGSALQPIRINGQIRVDEFIADA